MVAHARTVIHAHSTHTLIRSHAHIRLQAIDNLNGRDWEGRRLLVRLRLTQHDAACVWVCCAVGSPPPTVWCCLVARDVFPCDAVCVFVNV